MLFALLTLLLPYWASPVELEFHSQFVLCAHWEYYEQLVATGFRDRAAFAQLEQRTNYSMAILFWRKPELWRGIRRFRRQVLRLKKSLMPLEDIPILVEFPVLGIEA